jgi:hypothetical protein
VDFLTGEKKAHANQAIIKMVEWQARMYGMSCCSAHSLNLWGWTGMHPVMSCSLLLLLLLLFSCG